MTNKVFYTIIFWLLFASLMAQDKLAVEWKQVDEAALPKKILLPQTVNSLADFENALGSLLIKLRKESYVTASIDTFYCDSVLCQATFYLGEAISIKAIQNGNIEQAFWKKLKLPQDANQPWNAFESLQEQVVAFYENEGYPFAEVYLDSIAIEEAGFTASLFVEKNDLIRIDSLIVHGDSKTKNKFFQRYVDLPSESIFNQAKIDAISSKVQQLGFLQETKDAEIYFTEGKATVHVFLGKQRNNQFNLLLGVLPNNQLTDKKVTITGDGKLHLFNSFGVGEEIFAEFKQLKPRTQNLDIKFAYPYLLNSPIGTYGAFNLYKNDSLFIDIKSEVGLMYQFAGLNRIKFFYKHHTSNILNIDTLAIKVNGNLPENLDIRNNQYGLSLEMQELDYVMNPKKGFQFNIRASVGLQKIKVNQKIASLEDNEGNSFLLKYDSLGVKKLNYSIGFQWSQYIPLRKRSTFLLRNISEAYIAKSILNNEKFRIGGYKSIRGFDEEAIYTPFYSIFTAEYRFLLSKNSFFNLFSDVAIVENELKGSGSIDIPFGFGAGVALETKGGIFSLSYALGKNLNNKIDIKNGKIHFGFISLF